MERSKLKQRRAYVMPVEIYDKSLLIYLLKDKDLLITNENPDNLELNEKNIETYWITSVIENTNYKTLSPTDLPGISRVINEYGFKKKGIIAIDCLETLIAFNGFQNIAEFLFNVYGQIQKKEITLLLHLDKRAFTEIEYRSLLRIAVIDELD